MKMKVLPLPKKLEMKAGRYQPKRETILIEASQACSQVVKELKRILADSVGKKTEAGETLPEADIRLVHDGSLGCQAYVLDVAKEKIEIRYGEPAGAFYATQTLRQVIAQSEGGIQNVHIEDEPDLEIRGMLIDISRDKIPSMKTLYRMIDLFAMLKVNHLQLYVEGYSFAYPSYPEVWKEETPIAPEELRRIDQYCAERFIDLVANQNCMGHMSPWLVREEFNHLAESPEGFVFSRGEKVPPATIDPLNPEGLQFISNLMDDLLPNFRSEYFNVNLDEPFELGKGKTRERAEARGVGHVYMDHILNIHKLVSERGKKMMMWGDVLANHPEVMDRLPKDISIIEWGYEADHPYAERCRMLASAGVEFCLAPGTSAWRCIGGRTENMEKNILSAASNAKRYGAKGLITADWGDEGHWQYLPISYLGFAYGAAQSWHVEAEQKEEVFAFLDQMILRDKSKNAARILWDLGMYSDYEEFSFPGQSQTCAVLFRGLSFKYIMDAMKSGTFQFNSALGDVSCSDFIKNANYDHRGMAWFLKERLNKLKQVEMECEDGHLIEDEIQNAIKTIQHGANLIEYLEHMDRLCEEKRANRLRELAHDLEMIMSEHKRLWLARNREGGMDRSLGRFQKLLDEYQREYIS